MKKRGMLEDRLHRLQIQEATKKEEDQGPNLTEMSETEGHESPRNLSPVTLEGESESVVDLPDEMVIAILIRLPIKSIVRSLCVCKRWLFIIKTRAFISAHLALSISNPYNNYILVALERMEEKYILLMTDNNNVLTRHPELQFPLKFPFETRAEYLSLVGSCNGLVCLTDFHNDHHGRDIYLVNPSIQKYKKLKAECSCYLDLLEEAATNVVLGFGYCEVQNDYKVVRIFSSITNSDPPDRNIKAEIYSLNSGKWKVTDAPSDVRVCFDSGTFADGCLYWMPSDGSEPCRLQCLDLNNEVFREIETPAPRHELGLQYPYVMLKKNGSSALVTMGWEGEYRIGVYEMGRDSNGQVKWMEFMYGSEKYGSFFCDIAGFSRSGRIIYWITRPPWIGAINLDDLSAVEKLRLGRDDDTDYDDPDYSDDEGWKAVADIAYRGVDVNFVESLVLLGE